MLRPAHIVRGILTLSLCLLLIPVMASAQNPDLSGTWTFNAEMSELPAPPGGQQARGGGRGFSRTPESLTVTTAGNEITIEVTYPAPPAGQEARGGRGFGGQAGPTKYITDGEAHKTETQRGTTSITAEWKEGKLVVKEESTFAGRQGGESMTMTTNHTYSLSDDGKQLTWTQEREGFGGRGATTTKYVFDKKE